MVIVNQILQKRNKNRGLMASELVIFVICIELEMVCGTRSINPILILSGEEVLLFD
jgi:hypothetical protein